jgi:hypothetical protein
MFCVPCSGVTRLSAAALSWANPMDTYNDPRMTCEDRDVGRRILPGAALSRRLGRRYLHVLALGGSRFFLRVGSGAAARKSLV